MDILTLLIYRYIYGYINGLINGSPMAFSLRPIAYSLYSPYIYYMDYFFSLLLCKVPLFESLYINTNRGIKCTSNSIISCIKSIKIL